MVHSEEDSLPTGLHVEVNQSSPFIEGSKHIQSIRYDPFSITLLLPLYTLKYYSLYMSEVKQHYTK